MIELTRAVLADLGLIALGARPRFNVALTRGASLSADVYLDDGAFVHVKASELERLETEYRASQEAWLRFGEYVARPLGFATRDGWDILITQGVRAEPLALSHLGPRSPVPAAVAGFFARSAALARPAEPAQSHEHLLVSLRQGAATAAWSDGLAARLGERCLTALAQLPLLPQHGDFTRNNLGVTGQSVVVFDWEDFGAAQLPGLDLFTLVLSLADFEAPTLRAWLGRQPAAAGRLGALVEDSCLALGLDAGLFRSLVPLYLLVFLRLKAAYSERLRQSLIRLIEELTPDPVVRVA